MESTLGTRPSATWRSILKGLASLEQGIRVWIGNGYSTTIWRSSWIPEDGKFKVLTPAPDNYYPWKVAGLINPMTGMWDKDFIDRIFWEVDRRRILNIPLGSNKVDDRIVCHYS